MNPFLHGRLGFHGNSGSVHGVEPGFKLDDSCRVKAVELASVDGQFHTTPKLGDLVAVLLACLLILQQTNGNLARHTREADRLEVRANVLGEDVDETSTSGYVYGKVLTVDIVSAENLSNLLGDVEVPLLHPFLVGRGLQQIGTEHRARPKPFNRSSDFGELQTGLVTAVGVGRVQSCDGNQLAVSPDRHGIRATAINFSLRH